MNKIIKKALPIILSTATVLSCAACSKGDKDMENKENNAQNEIFVSEYKDSIEGVFDENNIVLTFPVFSDTHLEGGYAYEASYNKMVRAINASKEFATTKKLDALLIAGDLVCCTHSPANVYHGSEQYPGTYDEEYPKQSKLEKENFLRSITDTLDPSTKIFYCLGNHDSANGEFSQDFIKAFSGENNENYEWFYGNDLDKEGLLKGNRHAVINGYHMVALEPDCDDAGYEWLDNTLASIVAEDKTQTIFLLYHYRTANMTFASGGDKGVKLKAVLEKYPQVISFGGHTHTYLDFENAIMQSNNGFISVDTGSEGDLAAEYVVALTGNPLPINASKKEITSQSEGLLVEVDKNGNVRIGRYNYVSNAKIGSSWVIPAVKSDGTRDLLYTKDREGSKVAPVFTEGETEVYARGAGLYLTFPAATCVGKVYRYGIKVTNNETKETSTEVFATSKFYEFPTPALMPHEYTVSVKPDITIGDDYTVSIIAYDSWNNKSEPLIVEPEKKTK